VEGLVLVRLPLQLGLILLVAKITGEIFKRYLKQPEVLGELIAGMIIGPYALGGLNIPYLGPLFPRPGSAAGTPVSSELYLISQIAIIIFFFSTGLETDLRGLIRYGGSSTAIALGGILIPFLLGALTAVLLGYAQGMADPTALFLGAILATPSIGVATRILEDIGKLRTPEGVTILGSAMIGAILVVLMVGIVAGYASGSFHPLKILIATGWTVGFWLVLTGLGLILSRPLSRFLSALRSRGAAIALALSLAFIASALAEAAGLTALMGAFSLGLGLSSSEIARSLRERLDPLYDTFVPVFFVVMGMLFDFHALSSTLLLGLAVTSLAIIAKILGCGLPALGLKFNWLEALRIGLGAVPRGGFALAVALAGRAVGVISMEIFNATVMMTFVTTIITPPILSIFFQRR